MLSTHLIEWGEVTGQTSHFVASSYSHFVNLFQSNGETHPAVLAFIVLSGYCIHRNGLRHTESDIPAYGIRRTFRIMPVYLLATAAGVAAFAYAHHSNAEDTEAITATTSISGHCLAIKVTGVSAFYPSDYFCSLQGNDPLPTVAAEIWLYVVYAAACFLLLKGFLSDRRLAVAVGVAWIAGMVWVNAHPADALWWHNGSLLGFLAYWWVGAKFTDPAFASGMRRLLPLVFLGWVALTIVLTQDVTGSIFVAEARKMLFALAIGVMIVGLDTLTAQRLELPARLGKAGYSIYAFHAPVLVVLLIAGVPLYVAGLAAILAGLLSFKVYEWPLYSLGKRIGRYRRERRDGAAPPREPALGRATP